MQLVSAKNAAGQLGVSVPTVRRMIARGELTKILVPGTRMVRVDQAELDLKVYGGHAPPAPKPASIAQLAALHAKANQLDEHHGDDRGTAKAQIVRWAEQQFERLIQSTKELTFAEAHTILDELERQVLAVTTSA